ncbi:MAG: hypothetical protein QGG40_08075, partial [Myxococcota bacterium]|nr:hypothetical protein [Myxococcota bacterium]
MMRNWVVPAALWWIPCIAAADELPTLSLRSRDIRPAGLFQLADPVSWQGRVHLLAVHDTPRPKGVHTVAAIGGQGLLVSVDAQELAWWQHRAELPEGVRWLGALQPVDRMDPRLTDSSVSGWQT